MAALLATLFAGFALAAGVASGDEIGGATYKGFSDRGAAIEFTLSDDGSKIVSYKVDAQSDPSLGDSCTMHAEGRPPYFEGAAITSHSYSYQFANKVDLRGNFTGTQTATGTVRLYNEAVQNVRGVCDTGVQTYTVTTDNEPPPAPTGTGTGTGETTSNSTPGDTTTNTQSRQTQPTATATIFRTSIKVRRTTQQLSGRLQSPLASCVSGRGLLLRQGAKMVGKATSAKDGSFKFALSRKLRAKKLKVTVLAARPGGKTCTTVSSATIAP